MNLTSVQDEMAARLDTIEGLRVPVRGSGKVVPPAAVFLLPEEINYGISYGGGVRFDQEVTVLIGRANDQTAWKLLHEFASDEGPRSIKAVLDSRPTAPYQSCSSVTVTKVAMGSATVGGIDYVGATFEIDVMG